MTSQKPIVVTVHGGVVQDVQFPAGCIVPAAVHDYDVDGADDPGLEFDERGDPFVEAIWEPKVAPVPAAEDQADVPAVAAHLGGIRDAEARRILVEVYRWMYWNDDRDCWSPDKEVSGADTIQLLCGLLPNPPEVVGPGGGP